MVENTVIYSFELLCNLRRFLFDFMFRLYAFMSMKQDRLFWSGIQLVLIQSFLSHWLVAIPRLKSSVCPTTNLYLEEE